eukprot:559703-Prymnesium_polylepis.3
MGQWATSAKKAGGSSSSDKLQRFPAWPMLKSARPAATVAQASVRRSLDSWRAAACSGLIDGGIDSSLHAHHDQGNETIEDSDPAAHGRSDRAAVLVHEEYLEAALQEVHRDEASREGLPSIDTGR